jgi:hypothetical protein
MAYDSRRGVSVLFGGFDNARDNETWEWDGTNWSQKSPANAPSPREGPAMAYDSARGVTVLFGGFTAGNVRNGETWEWDGTNWTQRMPASSPSPRADTGMAFDSVRGVTVLFGGDTGGASDETWEWDGANWLLRTPATAPTGRTSHAVAYDSARGVTVLFGGASAGIFNAETWEWDGANWSKRSPVSAPSARAIHAMAYDSARGVTVLFGGNTGDNTDETWEWDGVNWSHRFPMPALSARDYLAMVYDAGRQVVVLFGGFIDAGSPINGETWEWTGPKPVFSQQPAALTVEAGQSAAFSVTAVGSDPLSYQWQKDGAPLSDGEAVGGTTTAMLTIDPAAAEHEGLYACIVSNPCGFKASQAAALVVTPRELVACGACGAGAATMMPLALFALCASVRLRRETRHQKTMRRRP